MQNNVVEQKKNQIIEFEKNISDSVQNRVTALTSEGRLHLPANYSVGNALATAWLTIQGTVNGDNKPALDVCTKESVANALLEMVTLGLNPAKKQCYFIVYGNKLGCFTSYFGKCAVIKRLKGIDTEPVGTIIYEGDQVELGYNELGEEIVTSHKTSFENKLKGKRIGAYATVMANGIKRSAVMTMSEIKESWTKNPSKGNKKDHVDFEGEFMKRTVIVRLVKMILQTSNDDDLLAETFIRNEDEYYESQKEDVIDVTASEVRKEIEEKSENVKSISFENDNSQTEAPVVYNKEVVVENKSNDGLPKEVSAFVNSSSNKKKYF